MEDFDYLDIQKKNIDKFRCRELSRFRTGEYQRCIELLDDPEFREAYESECQRTGVPHYMLHYLHWSVKDPEMAYTPSIEYGIRDRQVRVRLGRYLSKHFGHVLSEKKRPELVEKHNATALANCKFHIAMTPGRIETVYTRGPTSAWAILVITLHTISIRPASMGQVIWALRSCGARKRTAYNASLPELWYGRTR